MKSDTINTAIEPEHPRHRRNQNTQQCQCTKTKQCSHACIHIYLYHRMNNNTTALVQLRSFIKKRLKHEQDCMILLAQVGGGEFGMIGDYLFHSTPQDMMQHTIYNQKWEEKRAPTLETDSLELGCSNCCFWLHYFTIFFKMIFEFWEKFEIQCFEEITFKNVEQNKFKLRRAFYEKFFAAGCFCLLLACLVVFLLLCTTCTTYCTTCTSNKYRYYWYARTGTARYYLRTWYYYMYQQLVAKIQIHKKKGSFKIINYTYSTVRVVSIKKWFSCLG